MSPVRRTSRRLVVLWVSTLSLLLSLGVVACGDPTATATPTPTKTPTPAALVEQTSPSPVPTSTSLPTSTPALGPVIHSDDPNIIGALALPESVSPFTGMVVADPSVLNRMPAAVKISNSPIVRPQSGLSRADIVIEHLAEGGITRFTAIYHSEDAERIGSVRSARLIDLEIPALFDAFLVYSGASGEVTRMLDASDFAQATLSDWRSDPGFYRLEIPGRAYEHTLFTDTQLLWQVAQERGWDQRPRHRGWTWSEQLPENMKPASTIDIPYGQEYSDVHYEYDAALKGYRRWILGQPHLEDLTGQQLAPPNIVVIYANHVETLIVEDVLGSKSVEIQIWGQGRIQLFRDGQVKDGLWIRQEREDPLLFVDGNSRTIPLRPGKVWLQIVPLDMQVRFAP